MAVSKFAGIADTASFTAWRNPDDLRAGLPGRLHLASGLVLIAMACDAMGLSPAVSGFLLLAAGAAFMDRVGEAFIGREAVRAEILLLAGASAFAGAGLMMAGAARLGARSPGFTPR